MENERKIPASLKKYLTPGAVRYLKSAPILDIASVQRYLEYEDILEDIEWYLSDRGEKAGKKVKEEAAKIYVIEGDVDANFDHWVNIDRVIKKARERISKKKAAA